MSEKIKYVGFGALRALDKEKEEADLARSEEIKDQLFDSKDQQFGRPEASKTSTIETSVDVQDPITTDVRNSIDLDVQKHNNSSLPDVQTDDQKRGKRKMTVRYSPAIEQRIKDFCHKNRLPLQDFHELAITHFLDVQDAQSKDVRGVATIDVLAGKTSHDDLMIFKSHEDIIMLYKKLTGRRWTPSDDRNGYPLNNIDRRVVEIGMINTYLQAKGKRINSFAYFLPEIETMIEVHHDLTGLDSYLRRRREQLKKALG